MKKETYKLVSGKLYYEGIVKQGDTVELTDNQAKELEKSEGVKLEKVNKKNEAV
jgi:hypothetical protein